MPDIVMCSQDKCKRKDTCYRYIATPDPYGQSYAQFDVNSCTDYIECKSKAQKKRLNIQCEGE